MSGQSSKWAKVCEHVRSFLRTKLTPCLLLLLAYKPCSLLSSSVNLPTSLFQVESYNSIFLSDYVCQVIQRSSFFLQNQFRERQGFAIGQMWSLPYPTLTSPNLFSLSILLRLFYRGWDIKPSPHWGGGGECGQALQFVWHSIQKNLLRTVEPTRDRGSNCFWLLGSPRDINRPSNN